MQLLAIASAVYQDPDVRRSPADYRRAQLSIFIS
jgi:hypothetical protein